MNIKVSFGEKSCGLTFDVSTETNVPAEIVELKARIAALEEKLKGIVFTLDGVEYEVAKNTTWGMAINSKLFGTIMADCCGEISVIGVDHDSYVGKIHESGEICYTCWGGNEKNPDGTCANCGGDEWGKEPQPCLNCGGYFDSYVRDSAGNIVRSYDIIEQGDYTTVAPKTVFTIDGAEYQVPEGTTWYDACELNMLETYTCTSCGEPHSAYQLVSHPVGCDAVGKVVLDGEECCPNCGTPNIEGVIRDGSWNVVEIWGPIEPIEYFYDSANQNPF